MDNDNDVLRDLTPDRLDEVVGAVGLTVVVLFYAEWSGSSRLARAAFEGVARESREVTFVLVDIDQFPSVPLRFQVQSVPTILLFRDGIERKRLTAPLETRRLLAELEGFLQYDQQSYSTRSNMPRIDSTASSTGEAPSELLIRVYVGGDDDAEFDEIARNVEAVVRYLGYGDASGTR